MNKINRKAMAIVIGGGNSNRGGYRNNSNREHTIRVVTGPQPSTSNNQNNQNDQGDHFFRLT